MKRRIALILSCMILFCLLCTSVYASNPESPYQGTSCTENEDGSVTVNNSGYFSQTTFTKFSEGESAKMTVSADQLGTDWFTEGLTIVVNSSLVENLDDSVWQETGADGVFTFSFKKSGEQMVGMIYRYGVGTGTTAAADWAKADLSGDITIEVKKDGDKVALFLNGEKWDAGYDYNDDFAIPDGYLAIAPAQNASVTVKNVTGESNDTPGNYPHTGVETTADIMCGVLCGAALVCLIGWYVYKRKAARRNFS